MPRASHRAAPRQATVWLFEPDPREARSLRRALGGAYGVAHFADAARLLAHLAAAAVPPDALLLAVAPRADAAGPPSPAPSPTAPTGRDLLARVRAAREADVAGPPPPPVLALLAAGGRASSSTPACRGGAAAWLEAGADDCLVRPCDPAELRARVAALVRLDALRGRAHAAEQTLARERRRAEEAIRARDEFLSVASHELRTPLTAILGWARMLRSGSLAPDKHARALETIERNARIQVQLVEDILDASRIITGRLRLSVALLDIGRVVEAAVEVVRPAALARGVALDIELASDAGAVSADAARLHQIVWNLLANAVKFTPRGGRVSVALRRVNGYVELTVADTGQGIEPAFIPLVFDPFRQADASITRAHGGLGLGLAIVKHLVELHGGTITAYSAGRGTGAVFVVRIPVAPGRGGGGRGCPSA